MEISHVAAAAFALVVGIGVGRLAKSESEQADELHFRGKPSKLQIPREIAAEIAFSERREYLQASANIAKACATAAVAGIAACAALFATDRAAAFMTTLAIFAFFFAFVTSVIGMLEAPTSALRQLLAIERGLKTSKRDVVPVAIELPRSRFTPSTYTITLFALLVGVALIGAAALVAHWCGISAPGPGGWLGAAGERVCVSVRSAQGK